MMKPMEFSDKWIGHVVVVSLMSAKLLEGLNKSKQLVFPKPAERAEA